MQVSTPNRPLIALMLTLFVATWMALAATPPTTAHASCDPKDPKCFNTCEEADDAGLLVEPSNPRKVTLCHFTGSDSNPVVVNEVALSAATSHSDHHGDLWNCGSIADTINTDFCTAGGA